MPSAPKPKPALPSASRDGAGKLAKQVSLKIEERILRDGLRPGTRIGSEPDLIKEYGLSRAIFREAVRIMEHDGIAVMRRGTNGGLFITDPDSNVVSHAASLWLRFNGAGVGDLFEVREVLEARCAAWAADKVDDDGVATLRAALQREGELAKAKQFDEYTAQTLLFHETIANLAGNPVASLLVSSLCELNAVYGAAPHYDADEVSAEHNAHTAITEAIVAGDGALASNRMITHLRAGREFAERANARDGRRAGSRRNGKTTAKKRAR